MGLSRAAARIYSRTNQSAVNLLTAWLAEIYGSPVGWVRQLGTRPLYELRRRLQASGRARGLHHYWMQGCLPGSGQPLRVSVLMERKELDYPRWLFFREGQVRVESLEKVRAGNLAAAAHALSANADLVFIERSNLNPWVPASGAWAHGPTLLRMVYDFSPGQTWSELEKTFRKQSSSINRIKRLGLTSRETRSQADLEFFFHRLYVPMVQARHADYGILDTLADLQSEFRRSHLLMIEDAAGQVVAGAMNQVIGSVMTGKYIGVLDGRQDLIQMGAMSAVYYFSLRSAHKLGLRRLDVGRVTSLARQGIYQYKRRWNLRPAADLWDNHDWLFWAPTENEAALAWLEENPIAPQFARTSPGRLADAYQKLLDQGI